MKKILSIFLVLTMALALCACGEAAPEENAAIANPVHEVTAEELSAATGLMLNAPEGAESVSYAYIDREGGAPIAQLCFTLDGVSCTYRAASSDIPDGALEDISGMNYQWSLQDTAEVSYCQAELCWIESQQGRVAWYDAAPGILYSLSVDSGASKETLTALAKELFAPAQGEADGEGETGGEFQVVHVENEGSLSADLNGDGAEDTVSISQCTVDEFGSVQYGISVEVSGGLSTVFDEMYVEYKPMLWLADINGDGLPEILFSGDAASDDYCTVCLGWDGAALSCIHFADDGDYFMEGSVESINGGVITMGANQYVLGTYGGKRDFAVNDQGLIAPVDGSVWSFESNETWLITSKELPVALEGVGSVLPAGTELSLTGFDGDTAYFVTREGAAGTILLEKNDSFWGWLIDGVEETEYFESLPYAG